MPIQQQNQVAGVPVRRNTKDSFQGRDGSPSGLGRLRELTLGRLFRAAVFVVRAIIPTKRAREDDKRLLMEIRENDEYIKHHIARVVPLFQHPPQDSQGVHQHSSLPTLLNTVNEANLDPKEHFPLEPSESEIVLSALQQVRSFLV